MIKPLILTSLFISSVIYFSVQAEPIQINDAPETAQVATVEDPAPAVIPTIDIVLPAPTVEEKPELMCLGNFMLTAYCSCEKCCGKWSPEVTGKLSRTASGTNPKEGRTVAVDKNVIPLGTHILIDGHEYIAEDTGSAVHGKHVDIYFESHVEAKEFGRQKGKVYLIK